MDCRITFGSEAVRKACQTSTAPLKGCFSRGDQLSDQHLGLGLLLLMFGEVNERGKVLNDITALVPDRLMKRAAQNSLTSLRR